MILLNDRLRIFKAVVETMSFSVAAEVVKMTQPAVSKNIKSLEEQLEISLFERTTTRMSLTQSGRVLYDYVVALEKEEANLALDLSNIKELESSAVVGCTTGVIESVSISKLLQRLLKVFPKMDVKTMIYTPEFIEKELLEGRVDIALVGKNELVQTSLRRYQTKDEEVNVVVNQGINDNSLARDQLVTFFTRSE